MSAAKKAGDVKDHKGGAKAAAAAAGGNAKQKQKAAAHKDGDAPQPGDKPKLFGGSPEGQKVVIADIIDLIGAGDNSRTTLKIAHADLLTAFQKQDVLSTTNLYRKQYGNLKEMFNKEKVGFEQVFAYDGDIVMLRDVQALERAATHGLLSSALLQKCVALHNGKRKHDAETLRTNHENVCARCGARYKVMINVDGVNALCTYTPAAAGAAAGGQQKTRHVPTYDFTRNANDVLACAVSYAGVDLKTTAPVQPGDAGAAAAASR